MGQQAVQQREETEPILLVYIGQRLTREDKLQHYWIKVSPEQLESGTLPSGNAVVAYQGKNAKRYMTGSPGTVYEVPQVTSDSSIYSQDARYKCLWPNKEQRLEWQVEDRTETTTYDLRRQAKKEGAEDLFAPLRPFRQKYNRLLSQNQKAAFLAQVIAYLTAGGL